MVSNFQKEWEILHKEVEKYERYSLLVKLSCVLVFVLCMAYSVNPWLAELLILVLWLQDGIWKTFQKRLEARVLFVEKQIKNNDDKNAIAFQYYSQWEDLRQGVVGLVKEYLFSALKPTVAYPYVVLVILPLIFT